MQHNYNGNHSRSHTKEPEGRPGGYTGGGKPAANYYQKHRSGNRGRNNDHYNGYSKEKDNYHHRGSDQYYSKSRKNDEEKDYRRSKDKSFPRVERDGSPFASKSQNKVQSSTTTFEVQLSGSVEEKAEVKVGPVQTQPEKRPKPAQTLASLAATETS